MTVHHFGTSVDGSVFLEQVPAAPVTPTVTAAPQRPARGFVLKVRDYATGADLSSITTNDFGFWDYTTVDIPLIRVSGDNWATPGLVVRSAEAQNQAATSAADIVVALDTANNADAKATQALALAQANTGGPGAIESVNGLTGTVILTAATVGARPTGTSVPANEVSGLATVATTGAYGSLTGTPAPAIPTAEKGTANGVATLGVDGKLNSAQVPANVGQYDIYQLADGTWPLRNSVTADSSVRVSWWYYSSSSPNPQAGNGYVVGKDVLYKKV